MKAREVWSVVGALLIVIAVTALVAGCGTVRIYPPAPHYDGYSLEGSE